MRKYVFCAGLLLALLVAASPARAVEIRFRLSAGFDRLRFDNASLGVTGWAEELRLRGETFSNIHFVSESIANLKLGVDFEGELQCLVSRYFGFGLSAGYAYGSLPESEVHLTMIWDGVSYQHTKPGKLTAYPVMASGYLMLPLGSKFSAYLRAGAGYAFANFVGREGLEKEGDKKFYYTMFETAKAQKPMYVGAIGFTFNFDKAFGFFIEAEERSGVVKGFSGVDNLNQPGRLYAYEEYIADLNYWQPKVHVLPAPPSGSNFRSVREASFNLGGASARVGVLLKF
jgi:opacity protein-like surface antigen